MLVLLARNSTLRPLRLLARGYIELFQGTPLLMQLFLTFFGLSLLGLEVPAWLAAGLALTLFTSAYLAEIWRGCVDAIPHGPVGSLGKPGADPLRAVAPRDPAPGPAHRRGAHRGLLGAVVKGTAVTSIIGFTELTKIGGMLRQCDLPALHRLRPRGPGLFHPLLSAVAGRPLAGKETACRCLE